MTLTKNEILDYDEEANAYPYKMISGFRYEQARGLIAEVCSKIMMRFA